MLHENYVEFPYRQARGDVKIELNVTPADTARPAAGPPPSDG
jgi:hypothetical protein